jgi:hypothetical protein
MLFEMRASRRGAINSSAYLPNPASLRVSLYGEPTSSGVYVSCASFRPTALFLVAVS